MAARQHAYGAALQILHGDAVVALIERDHGELFAIRGDPRAGVVGALEGYPFRTRAALQSDFIDLRTAGAIRSEVQGAPIRRPCCLSVNGRIIGDADELQRKVQLNAMAITLGVCLIAGVPFSVLDSYHVIPFHADIAYLLILMSLTFAVSNLFGTRRYR